MIIAFRSIVDRDELLRAYNKLSKRKHFQLFEADYIMRFLIPLHYKIDTVRGIITSRYISNHAQLDFCLRREFIKVRVK